MLFHNERSAMRYAGSARFYMYTDSRWIGPTAAYGPLDQNFSTSAGTGADPVPGTDVAGFPVFAGDHVTRFSFEADVNNTEVAALDIALVHRSAAGGAATVIRKWLNQAAATTKANSVSIFERLPSIWHVPENGHVAVFVRPVGALSATQYAYGVFAIEMMR